ncbi:MAG: rod shape-determining protein MreD [Clostridia bacterium]|nr:rod shape-determining protein MreD [Clostridia bacterium]
MTTQHKHKYLRFIGYSLLLLVCFIVQTVPFMIKIGNAYPNPMLILTIIIAMYEGDKIGTGFGLASGILMDLVSVNGSGFHAITYMLTGLACGLLVEILVQNNIISAFVLGIATLGVNSVLEWLFKSLFSGLSINLYFSVYFPSAIYSLAILIPAYLLFSKIFGFKIRYKPPSGLPWGKLSHKSVGVRKRDY